MDRLEKAPVQGYSAGIPWSLHLRAYDVYAAKWGRGQSAERIAERGGFAVDELDEFVPGWRDEASEIASLRTKLAKVTAERDKAVQRAVTLTRGQLRKVVQEWQRSGMSVEQLLFRLQTTHIVIAESDTPTAGTEE